MARLPQVGGDDGNWGGVLNDFLLQSHSSDGTLSADSVGAPQLKQNAITGAAIAPETITENELSPAVQAKINATQTSINTKVDRVSTLNRVYGTDGTGAQNTYGITGNPTPNTIAYRATNGVLAVGTPTVSGHAATKGYVDAVDISKEPVINAGTSTQYWRGDKTWQSLDKTSVGLSDADNTSDTNKPISSATQTALNAKQATLVSGASIKTINSTSLLGSGNILIPDGDITGPAASADNSIPRFDALTGKALQGSSVYIDDSNRLSVNTSSAHAKLTVQGESSNNEFIGLFMENGITPENTITGSTRGRMVSVQGNNGAYYMGRDVTNDIEFIMGTSSLGAAFAGSTTSHDFELRTGNSAKITIQHSTGFVGMGTSSPTQKLSVSGGISTTGPINGRDIATDAQKVETNGMGVTIHGSNASAARPTGFAVITWIGSVAPLNATTNDIWMFKA